MEERTNEDARRREMSHLLKHYNKKQIASALKQRLSENYEEHVDFDTHRFVKTEMAAAYIDLREKERTVHELYRELDELSDDLEFTLNQWEQAKNQGDDSRDMVNFAYLFGTVVGFLAGFLSGIVV